jgi:Dolichyl-phosphate-mannose-protein mannosyltransferase
MKTAAHPAAGGAAPDPATAPAPRVLFIVAIVAIASYALLDCIYLLLNVYFVWVEPGLIVVSSLVARGYPVYQSAESGIQYNHMYGPVHFLLNAIPLKLLGQNLFAGKLTGGVFGVLSLAFLYAALRNRMERSHAAIGAGLLALFYFVFSPIQTYDARPDALILGFVALGLWGATLRKAPSAALAIAIALGAVMNVKAHSGVYFLPILVLMWQRHGLRWVVAALLGGAAVFWIPFLLPDVSWMAYLHTMLNASQQGLEWHRASVRIEQVLIFLALPTLMVLLAVEQPMAAVSRWRLYLAAWAVALLLVIIVSSHRGSEKEFLFPLAITLAYWLTITLREGYAWHALWARRTRGTRVRCILSLALFVVMAGTILPNYVRTAKLFGEARESQAYSDDVQAIMASHPGRKIAMGYGSRMHAVQGYARTDLIFAGNPVVFELVAMADYHAAGNQPPEALLRALDSCAVDIWLIPQGDEPFLYTNVVARGYMFNERLRQTFLGRYQRRESSRYYDLWHCVR